ncbi:MAG: GntR family transcriptional regulator [Clostridia bacterium]|nr:GntR family transcriptional regulator [Clostridia bacterium]
MAWQFNQHEPVFLQISNRLRAEILCGKYPPDTQIPSVRQLASEAAVNPNTMQRALSQLEEEGILHSHGTLGRFVTSDVEVLERAREEMRRKTVRMWLEEAKSLNIPTEKIIQYIKEEERKI